MTKQDLEMIEARLDCEDEPPSDWFPEAVRSLVAEVRHLQDCLEKYPRWEPLTAAEEEAVAEFRRLVKQAVVAVREECAKLAEATFPPGDGHYGLCDPGYCHECDRARAIAAAIRGELYKPPES